MMTVAAEAVQIKLRSTEENLWESQSLAQAMVGFPFHTPQRYQTNI